MNKFQIYFLSSLICLTAYAQKRSLQEENPNREESTQKKAAQEKTAKRAAEDQELEANAKRARQEKNEENSKRRVGKGNFEDLKSKNPLQEICSWLEPNAMNSLMQASKSCQDFIEKSDELSPHLKKKTLYPEKWNFIDSYKKYQKLSKRYVDLRDLVLKFKNEAELVLFLSDKKAQKEVEGLRFVLSFSLGPQVFSLLGNFTQLKRLSFVKSEVGGAFLPRETADLALALQNLKQLTSLDLSESRVVSAAAQQLIPALGNLENLTALDLSGSDLGGAGAQFAPVLGKLTRLAHLGLSNNALSGTDIKHLAPELRKLTHLKDLSFAGNPRVFQEAVVDFAFALENLTELNDLVLSRNGLRPEDMEHLAPALKKLKNLTSLELNSNPLGRAPEGAQRLASVLSELPRLSTLYLRSVRLEPPGIKILSPVLGTLTQLTDLDLSFNSIGLPTGAADLAAALENLTLINSLDLTETSLEEAGARSLAPSFPRLNNLKHLNIRGNPLGLRGLQPLISAMESLKLNTLDLSSTLLGTLGAKYLAAKLGKQVELKSLDLYDNKLGVEGIQALLPEIKKLTHLRRVTFDDRKKLPEDFMKKVDIELKKANPKLEGDLF